MSDQFWGFLGIVCTALIGLLTMIVKRWLDRADKKFEDLKLQGAATHKLANSNLEDVKAERRTALNDLLRSREAVATAEQKLLTAEEKLLRAEQSLNTAVAEIRTLKGAT